MFLDFHFVSLSVYRGYGRMYIVPVMAQYTTSIGMALYYLLLLSKPLLPVSYFCYHRPWFSRTKNQRGHWVCWMSTSRKNSLMSSTHIYSSTYLFKKRQEQQLVPFFLEVYIEVPFRKNTNGKVLSRSLYLLLCESHGNSLLKSLREIPRL